MTNKTYNNKYKLGQLVWIKSEDDIAMEVMVNSIILAPDGDGDFDVAYVGVGGDVFLDDDVIERRSDNAK